MKVLLLSAGLGTRLKPLTDEIPKVMVQIGGKPVLEHLIILCKKHGLTDLIINLHYKAEVISDYFQDGSHWGVHIDYSDESGGVLGGAGALKRASLLISHHEIMVINGDVLTNLNLTNFITYHHQKGGWGSITVHDTDHPYDSDVVEFDQTGLISKIFRPNSKDAFKPISNSGIHLFKPEVLAYIPPNRAYSLESELIPDLLAHHKPIYAYYSTDYAKDMGTPTRLEQVRLDYKLGKVPL
jgi:NDP-sugar pyrophosphorylase family protein